MGDWADEQASHLAFAVDEPNPQIVHGSWTQVYATYFSREHTQAKSWAGRPRQHAVLPTHLHLAFASPAVDLGTPC